jgi:hypothetical protein
MDLKPSIDDLASCSLDVHTFAVFVVFVVQPFPPNRSHPLGRFDAQQLQRLFELFEGCFGQA